MPKPRSKRKKSVGNIGLSDELDLDLVLCCSNRNCPSHWHDHPLTEKVKLLQQSKSKASCTVRTEPEPTRSYLDVVSNLFEFDDPKEDSYGTYSTPVRNSLVLEKHHLFASQILNTFTDERYSFRKNNLPYSLGHRMIPLVSDPHSQIRSIRCLSDRRVTLFLNDGSHGSIATTENPPSSHQPRSRRLSSTRQNHLRTAMGSSSVGCCRRSTCGE
jgi:hypothetical protein